MLLSIVSQISFTICVFSNYMKVSLDVAVQIMHRINFIHSGLLINLGREAPYIVAILTIYLIAVQ